MSTHGDDEKGLGLVRRRAPAHQGDTVLGKGVVWLEKAIMK